jgi:superfamily II DNA/RNA helicase
MFSATFDDDILQNIKKNITEFSSFRLKTEALALKGVKQFYLIADNKKKLEFMKKFCELCKQCAMIFTNVKATALYI